MFIDYYEILEIDFNTSDQEIKNAYRKQSIKWHPDKNPNIDTLSQMQLINAAYLILKDPVAKKRYDIEYLNYKSYQQNKKRTTQNSDQNQNEGYSFNDEVLKRWMNNALKQGEVLARQTIVEFKIGTKAAGEEMIKSGFGFLIIGILFTFIFIISKACN